MTATQIGIQVVPNIKWNDALARAEEQGLWIQPVAGDGTDWSVWAVESFSGRAAGLSHTVTVDLTVSPTEVACDCTAGQHGAICTHAALALRDSLSFPYATLARVAGLGNPLVGSAERRAVTIP